MILVSTGYVPGKNIVKSLGLVRGNTIRARHLGRDIIAFLRNVVGGEITDYTKMMAESREQSLDRMVEEADASSAVVDGIVDEQGVALVLYGNACAAAVVDQIVDEDR